MTDPEVTEGGVYLDSNAAPVIDILDGGFLYTARRASGAAIVEREGIAVVVAVSALTEWPEIPVRLSANKIRAPRVSSMERKLSEDEWEVVTKALYLGHVSAGHVAWLEPSEDVYGNKRTGIHCVDCNRASEARAALQRANRP